MSSAARPQPTPAGQPSRGGAPAPMPPQPTSILQKQSSFSKKAANGQPSPGKAPGAPPQPQGGAPPQARQSAPYQQQPPPQQPQMPQMPGGYAKSTSPQPTVARPAPAAGAKAMTPQAGPKPVTPQAAAKPVSPQANAARTAGKAPAPPGMWGPNNEIAPANAGPQSGPFTMGPNAGPAAANRSAASPAAGPRSGASPAAGARNAPAASPASGARGVPAGPQSGAPTPTHGANGAGMQRQGSFGGGGMQRQGSFGGGQSNPYGSMGPGAMQQQPSAFGSMGPGAMGSMGPAGMGSMGPGAPGSMGPGGYGSMGPSGYGTMGANDMQGVNGAGGMGSLYGATTPGSMGPGGMGSMYGANAGSMAPGGGMGSMYGGSMMGGNSFFGGSQFGSMGPGMMGGGAGSLYGMPGVNRGTSAYGFAAQWGSLANMSGAPDRSNISRSNITSEYGGFGSEVKGYRMEDLCPNIGTLDEGNPVKRSGRRGGNHLYSRDKNDRSAPVITSNAKASAMTIKRKDDDKSGTSSGSKGASDAPKTRGIGFNTGAAAGRSGADRKTAADGRQRAKAPSNYDLHTLHIIEGAAGSSGVQVKDPNTIVLEKDGKRETFETDEAIAREKSTEELDSVLLSSLVTSWHGGHNTSLFVGAGKGMTQESVKVANGFVRGAVERLEKMASANYFDITINMVAIRGGNQVCDLLKPSTTYEKMQLGSNPVYGPCLLGLTDKVVKTAKECVATLEKGFAASKDPKEMVTAFLVLKQSKKGGDKEVRLSSLCVSYVREEMQHLTDIKDKSSSAPYQLFRYAVGGASVCVSALVVKADDENARSLLDTQRKMREVKNRAPRSGNLQKFIEYTQKEANRQKEKLAKASDSDKRRIESQVSKMEDMIKDIQAVLDNPETSKPKGYALPS